MKGLKFKANNNFNGKEVKQHHKYNGEEADRAKSNEFKLKKRRRQIAKMSKRANY